MRSDNYRPGRLLCGLFAALLAAPLAAAPAIQEWQTSNGARVLFVAADALPMVDIEVVFDAGSARDGDQPGLAVLTSSLLGDGAGGRDAQALAEAFEGLGARFGSDAGQEMASLTLRSLTDPALLDPAVGLLADVLARPTFAEADFSRERDRMLVGLQGEKQSPGALADKAFRAALYGDHPYGSPPSGTEESLAALTRDDAVGFHRRYYVASNALFAIVGDLERDAAEALAERLSAGLAAGTKPAPLPEVADLAEARRVHVEFPSQQTHVRVGQPAVRRGDPDHFALYVGNHVLGGSGLVSRLNDTIREQRGLAYSVYSYFQPMRRRGPFQMGLQTRNDQAAEALGLLDVELRRYVADGPSKEELGFSRRSVIGGFPMRIDSNRKLVGYLAMIGFYDLPLDYLATFNERIEAVGLDDVRAALQGHVDPDRMVTVTVGPSPAGGG